MLTAERTFDAQLTEVWDLLTNPERLPRWFMPIDGDLKEGGKYRFDGSAGGTIERCQAPRSLAVTWEYGEMLSWLEVNLDETEGKTRLVLRHIVRPDSHWKKYGPGAVGVGWDLALLGLARHLASGETVDAAEAEKRQTSGPEGRAYVTRVSDSWCQADIEGGEDPDEARARARRTTAAYINDEEPE